MLKPIHKNFTGLVLVTGPTKSGKSQLAEFLIQEQETITYIATSKPRPNDAEWEKRMILHKKRRPNHWGLIEYPQDICTTINSMKDNDSVLIDSLGGVIEQYLSANEYNWNKFKHNFIGCIKHNKLGIILVSEEIGWGIVPSTSIGHLFRERLSELASLISMISTDKWLAVNGTAINLSKIGFPIP